MLEIDTFCMGLMGNDKRKAGGAAGDPAFERWFSRQMHKLYDEVLAEDVPEELLRIVERASGNGSAKPPEDDEGTGPDGGTGLDGQSGKGKRESR